MPPSIQLEALSWIFIDLSVAYCDFDSSASSTVLAHPLSKEQAEYLRCFTHVVRIVHAKTVSGVGERKVDFNEEHGIHTLSLLVPPASRRNCLPRGSTVLTVNQLEAAKDFLCLALPYDSAKFPRSKVDLVGDRANVLITAPKWDSGEVDVTSVVLSYLSFISYKSVLATWQEIRANDCSIGFEWRRGFGEGDEKGLCFIQRVVDWWVERARREKADDIRDGTV